MGWNISNVIEVNRREVKHRGIGWDIANVTEVKRRDVKDIGTGWDIVNVIEVKSSITDNSSMSPAAR